MKNFDPEAFAGAIVIGMPVSFFVGILAFGAGLLTTNLQKSIGLGLVASCFCMCLIAVVGFVIAND